ncbi:MAG: alpha/beta fold hydrolase [Gammaproteobacteria bacterium]|nr:alpha/beta fold hydrolase [Gammaproteobacteria bacterium]
MNGWDYKYSEQSPRRSGLLPTGDGHELYFEEYGSPGAIPVVEIHGGPGVGSIPEYHRFFDPDRYHLLMYDQRGSGRSLPLGELRNNTTQHLIADLELLREMLDVKRWVISGWSWGTTLALAYAQAYPDRVLAIVLRGAWTAREEESAWFGSGLRNFFPDIFDRIETDLADVPDEKKLKELVRIATDDTLPAEARETAACDYSRYELYACYLEATEEQIRHDLSAGPQLPIARIGEHFRKHRWFMDENQLWKELDRITHIPCTLIHGRYDIVAVPRTSYELHKAWPGSELIIASASGHMSSEPGMAEAMTATMDKLAGTLA